MFSTRVEMNRIEGATIGESMFSTRVEMNRASAQ
jgi:hypothetical protein